MKVFKFKKFPREVMCDNEKYTFELGGSKYIEVHVERKGHLPDVFVFNNVKNPLTN